MIVFNIKNIMNKKDIKLKELSIKTGFSESYLEKIMNNKVDSCNLFALYRIAQELDEDVKNIFHTTFELPKLKKQMYYAMEKHGLISPQTIEISEIIDTIITKLAEEQSE